MLSIATGFICREDKPDFGCDFDVELMINGKAADWRFPCQLKSVESITFIGDGNYISYSFLTSRLGYLMTRKPSMGIIVLYCVQSETLYFDYADKLYQRLLDERETTEWKQNDSVNIHFPVSQVLDVTAAAKLLSTMRQRFESGIVMQESFGKLYGLPVEGVDREERYDFNNPNDISKYLTKYGLMLLNNYDLGDIHRMILQIPNQEIFRSAELLAIAAVSYCEAGVYVDADFYVCKLRARLPVLDGGMEEMTRFTELKVQLALGAIDEKKFIDGLRSMPDNAKHETSRILIWLNIVRYELIEVKTLQSVPPAIESDIEGIFGAIRTLEISPRKKGSLMLWNAQNLSISVFSQQGVIFQMKESLGTPVPIQKLEQNNDITPIKLVFPSLIERLNRINTDDCYAQSGMGRVKTFNLFEIFDSFLRIPYPILYPKKNGIVNCWFTMP